jgi:hypothetical protein
MVMAQRRGLNFIIRRHRPPGYQLFIMSHTP